MRPQVIPIAVLTPGFAANEAETNCVPVLQDFLIALKDRRPEFRPTVFSLHFPQMRAQYTWHGIDVFAANGQELGFPFALPSWSRMARDFARVHRRQPIRIIHSFWLGECALIGTFLSRAFNIPHVITFMGQEVVLPNRYVSLLKSKRTTFVAVSPFQRRELLKHTGYDVQRVIPWGFDAPAAGQGPRDIDVLGAGSLTDVKAFDVYLAAVAQLRKVRPGVRCRIAGDGPLRSDLQEKAARLGLDVRFEGRVTRELVLELMRRSKVLLHTSTFESFGLVFAEALGCGLRIVSRPVGIAEAGERWALCEDPQDMATAVDRFLAAEPLGPTLAYPLGATVAAYGDLYSRLLGSAHPAAHTSREGATS